MRILSLVILFVLLYLSDQKTQSPHGSSFKVSCKTCHSTKGWQVDKKIYSFNHNKTKMPLVGQHSQINCRLCHTTLVFNEAKSECIECHKDMHQGTTSPDCSRCHTSASWLVNNINAMHEKSRFPLLGAHRTADCIQCHKSESLERYDVLGVNCVDCHRENYMATTNPNHVQSGISDDCSLCHPISAFQWNGAGFNHNVFPLVQGHSFVKCADCHKTGKFTNINTDCYSCHQKNYTATTNPNHVSAGFSTTCTTCHTTTPGWKPATFNHTTFPLTLGHAARTCIDCHKGGSYASTSKDCYSCHQQDYTATKNPNHISAGFPTLCATCHTTTPGWKPATFNHTSFPLTLGHASPSCADCHKGNYTTTSRDCYSCHTTDYNSSTNPNHKTLAFATVCTQCHTTTPGWKPASYTQHDSQSFPIYSGKHRGQWTVCTDCHTNTANYSIFTCITCHNKPEMDNKHSGRSGYSYDSPACLRCHPKGSA
jgi:predicted CXXCH cytochrome family protein